MTEHVLARPPALWSVLWRAWATRSKRPGRVLALPAVRWTLPRVVVQASAVERYRDVCGFSAEHGVPLTYPQLLTFPLVMAYLCSSECPWPAVGTVHLANVIEQIEPLCVGDEVSIELATGALRSHDKGQVYDLDLWIRRDGHVVWRGTQTLLRRGVREPEGSPWVSAVVDDSALQPGVTLNAPANIGRRYAWVSGDFNPMHLSWLSARLLGFRRTIAHGLWTQARALSQLLPPEPLAYATLTTEFKSPVFLPTPLSVWQHAMSQHTRFDVRDTRGERVHLRASFIS
jgi:acyl dehydratase